MQNLLVTDRGAYGQCHLRSCESGANNIRRLALAHGFPRNRERDANACRLPLGESRRHGACGESLRRVTALSCLLVMLCGTRAGADEPNASRESRFSPSRLLAKLAIPALHESSGLAPSHIRPDMLWSHNDSGDDARLFAFDLQGSLIAAMHVQGASAQDWEDMASFQQNGKPYLLVGDTGDNQRHRTSYTLYRIPEQPPDNGALEVDQAVEFRFETGPADCEAIAFDTERNEVLLVDKGWDLACRVYVLSWPSELNDAPPMHVARHISTLHIAGVTGMDIDRDGRHAIVSTYGSAYEFSRKADEDWKAAFGRKGCTVPLPARKQGESICYAADGQSLFLTSEFAPSPLFQLTLRLGSESSP